MAIRDRKGFVVKLEPNEIFVFGSNLAGIHGAGAALTATRSFGAELGVGEGLTGRCYAIPTKDKNIMARFLHEISYSVGKFISIAKSMPDKIFIVTPVGCGLAGFTHDQIAPMFKCAPLNCVMPDEWEEFLK
jgi:hypothetical protein